MIFKTTEASEMATITALSSPRARVFDLLPNKLRYSSPSIFSFHHNTFLRLPITCNAQLDASAGEVHDEIGEAFFEHLMVEDDSGDEDDDDEEEEEESSVDLFVRFMQAMFKKLSKRAKKASRSILPAAISPQLVSFAVDGILLLAALSIVKALLEVVCTLGGTVFVVILLLRVTWAAVSYFQSNSNSFNQGGSSFGTTQPTT